MSGLYLILSLLCILVSIFLLYRVSNKQLKQTQASIKLKFLAQYRLLTRYCAIFLLLVSITLFSQTYGFSVALISAIIFFSPICFIWIILHRQNSK